MAVGPPAAEFPLGGPHPILFMKRETRKAAENAATCCVYPSASPLTDASIFVVTVPKNAKKPPRNNIEKLLPERKKPEVKFSGRAGRAGRARNCYVHEGYLLAGILFVKCIDALLSVQRDELSSTYSQKTSS